jgi:N6-adenosine-specific RNA methylase IME4
MPIKHLVRRGVIHMWIVNSCLPEAIEILREWGFEYKDVTCWVKTDKEGCEKEVVGKFFTHPFELCLFATKGNIDDLCAPIRRNALPGLIVEERPPLASQKPDVVYSRIRHHWKAPLFMEFYARSPQCHKNGWIATGNEIDEEVCSPLPEVPEGT